MSNSAPILVISLDRYEHFRRCIESLSANLTANKTDLFIALDYPLTENQWIGYEKIVSYIDTIAGFKTVNVIKRDINYGRVKNYFEAKKEVLNVFDRLIFTEDDNEFSSDFLSFMNRCLDVYKDTENIFSISGYNYPISMPSSYPFEVYKWIGHSAWGFGIWKEKWEKIDWDVREIQETVREFLKNYKNVNNLNSINNQYIPMMIEMIKKEDNLYGDLYICLYQFINNMYSIFPSITRVKNMGHDGSGINCSYMRNDIYKDQDLYKGSGIYKIPYDLKQHKGVNQILKNHFKNSSITNMKTFIKLFLLNSGFYSSK